MIVMGPAFLPGITYSIKPKLVQQTKILLYFFFILQLTHCKIRKINVQEEYLFLNFTK